MSGRPLRFCAFVIADAVGVRRSRLRVRSTADVSFFGVLIGLAFGNWKSAMLKGDGSRVVILLKRCTVSNLLPKLFTTSTYAGALDGSTLCLVECSRQPLVRTASSHLIEELSPP